MHRRIFVADDGRPMMVLRPTTAVGKAVALSAALIALEKQDSKLLEHPPADEYRFVGYLATDRKTLVDENGKTIGECEPGDSLVTHPESCPHAIGEIVSDEAS